MRHGLCDAADPGVLLNCISVISPGLSWTGLIMAPSLPAGCSTGLLVWVGWLPGLLGRLAGMGWDGLRLAGMGWDWLGLAGLGWDWLGWAGLARLRNNLDHKISGRCRRFQRDRQDSMDRSHGTHRTYGISCRELRATDGHESAG